MKVGTSMFSNQHQIGRLNLRLPLSCAALFAIFAGGLKADNIAYVGTDTGEFGTMDLNTGAFTVLGSTKQTLAGMAVASGSIFATAYHRANSTLFLVNPANGSLTSVGSTGINVDDFGSTTSGLYAVSFGAVQDLYSINPTTGAATLIGPTGIGYGSWRGLSDNSGTLYFADGPDLYTLSTSTGAATLVGPFGDSAEEGVLLVEGGTLYGGDDTKLTVDTINISTGAATLGPSPSSGFTGHFYGFAPYPVPTTTPVPETASWKTMLGGMFLMIGVALRRHRRS